MSLEAEINFCLNFLKALDDKKSSVYSPASLLNALAIIYIGSGGKTAEELSKIIGKDQTKAAIIEYYSNFVKRHKSNDADIENEKDICDPQPEKKLKKDAKQELEAADDIKDSKHDSKDEEESDDDADEEEEISGDDEEEYYSSEEEEEEDTTPSSKLIMANRIFVNENIQVIKAFEELLKEKFDDKIQRVNFNDAEAAETTINEFVKKITHGMIKEVIATEDISPTTSVMLINAIYFIGKWENTFTFKFKEKFYSTLTEIREMKFMKIGPLTKFYFNEGEEWKAVGIPYRERQCWMFIILPKKKNDLENLIQKMDYFLFLEATKGTDSGYITVTMPMFEISENYDLQDSLSHLGLKNVFNKCDLSEMLNGPYKIDKAIHKAMIKVDVYGTVASAVTAATAVFRSSPSNIKIFIADHPFLYFIVSMKDHAPTEILFAGKFC